MKTLNEIKTLIKRHAANIAKAAGIGIDPSINPPVITLAIVEQAISKENGRNRDPEDFQIIRSFMQARKKLINQLVMNRMPLPEELSEMENHELREIVGEREYVEVKRANRNGTVSVTTVPMKKVV